MTAAPVEIAQKQRHLALLEKVKSYKTLTAGELRELQGYEKQMAKKKQQPDIKIKAKAATPKKPAACESTLRIKSAKKSTQSTKSTKKSTVKKKGVKKIKRKRLPVSRARVRDSAITAESMAAAEVTLKLNRRLSDILDEFPVLSAAWSRGRLLKNLASLAATAATIDEAGEAMALDPGKLDELLQTDPEVADIWNEARLATIIKIKTAIVDKACDGNVTAARQVETILRREVIHPTIDFTHLTTKQMVEVTGNTRQTIHDWVANRSMPRNSDKTFNLRSFIGWYEAFVFSKADGGKGPAAANLNPFQKAKAESLQMDLDKKRGKLLDRGMVIAGQVARHQALVGALNRKPQELSLLCVGASQQRIEEILETFCADVRSQLCQVPDSLRLSPDQAKILSKLLEDLNPKGA